MLLQPLQPQRFHPTWADRQITCWLATSCINGTLHLFWNIWGVCECRWCRRCVYDKWTARACSHHGPWHARCKHARAVHLSYTLQHGVKNNSSNSTFTNSSVLNIGQNRGPNNIGENGIDNIGIFNNDSGGTIAIYNIVDAGIPNQGNFTNKAGSSAIIY